MYITQKKYWSFLFTIDIIGNILFFWTKLKKPPKRINKILFIRLEHIGDMVLATPIFESFKKEHPECKIHVLCKTLSEPIIKYNPYVNKIITYDPSWMIQRQEDPKKTFYSLISTLRKEKYDLVFEMHGDPRNNLITFLTGSYTIGYSCRGGGFFLNKIIQYNPKKRMIEQNLDLITNYCKKTTDKTRIFVDNNSKKEATKLMKKYNLKSKQYIIINPLSGRKEKDLTTEEVNKFIKEYSDQKIVITGSKSEIEKNKVYNKYTNIINVTGKTNLLVLTEIVQNAKKVIAPDTGIIHIAKAVKTPFEAVYKTTDKSVWGY
ncbi:MAG: glycosyltransferase family 9 protein [Nanoarchaeota archaeon]|nr:glycosyltransferase family 9 protein [Nanoarchaeota archaeon]